jgi:uncharacterized protein YdiU (UPF0061 family)
MGRYAYCNQPPIAHWNLAGFAQTLLPLLAKDSNDMVSEVTDIVNTFPKRFQEFYRSRLFRKIGLLEMIDGDDDLAQNLLACMTDGRADFTLTFRRLCDLKGVATQADESLRTLFDDSSGISDWIVRWRQRLSIEHRTDVDRTADMRRVNPLFIPRNHLVEKVIRAAEDNEDLEPFNNLVDLLIAPYEDQQDGESYIGPPSHDEVVKETFCGT